MTIVIMSTTIQISDETKQLLSSLKDDSRKTYDEIIRELMNEQGLLPKSMFGTHRNLKWNKKVDGLKFDDD